LQFDPTGFLQGDGEDKGDTAMAMALMGYGGRGASPEELGLSREELLAKIAGQTGTQDIERQKLEEIRRGNLSAEDFQKFQKDQLLKNAADELKYKQDLLKSESEKSQDVLNAKVYELLAPEDRPAFLKNISKAGQQTALQVEAAQQAAGARNLLPAVKQAYEKGDVGLIKQLTEKVDPAVLQRPEFEWQKWNQGMVPASHRGITGGQGLLGLLWNTPGALKNVGKGIANVASSALLGEGAPQAEYEKFTDPRRYRAEQLAQAGPQEGPVRSEAPLSLANLLESVKSPTGPVVSEPPIDVLGANRRFPMIDARDYSKFPGSVEDLIAASGTRPPPTAEPSVGLNALAGLVAPPINAGQPATGGEEELLNQNLASLVAPNLSAIQESQYAPPASFPRQMRQPGFEYQAGGPSALPGRWLPPERERYPTGAAGPLDWRAILGL
jgi:hypothetical protein